MKKYMVSQLSIEITSLMFCRPDRKDNSAWMPR